MTDSMTAAEIVSALRRRYGCERDGIAPEWASLDEHDLGPGWPSRSIDVLFVRMWRGKKGHERHAVEVKVSRSDLRRELESGKWRDWWPLADRFYLAVPASLSLDGLDIPDEWGIYTVSARGVSETRRAPANPAAHPLPADGHWLDAFRRASRAEAKIRAAHASGDLAARVAALEDEVASKERQLLSRDQAIAREKGRAAHAYDFVAELAPPGMLTCRTCGVALKRQNLPGRPWKHDGDPGVHPHHGTTCTIAAPDVPALAAALEETAA